MAAIGLKFFNMVGNKNKTNRPRAKKHSKVEILGPDNPLVNRSTKEDFNSSIIEILGEERVPSVKAGEIVSYNPLTAYLREMRSIPKLSREEEYELAVQYKEEKNLRAAYRLVSGNLWLVVKIAKDYQKAAKSLLDLIQEGNIGLMEAVKNFDPYRGVRFPSYAVWWIKAYMVRYLIANWRMVKIGTTQAQRKLFFNLQKEKEKLEREGFFPEPKLLAERLDVKEREVIEMEQRLGTIDISVDAPLSEDQDGSLLSLLPNEQANAEEVLARKEYTTLMLRGLKEFRETLNEKELQIYDRRLLNDEKATLHDLSEVLGISKERVRQIENKIKGKLKNFFEEKFGSSLDSFNF